MLLNFFRQMFYVLLNITLLKLNYLFLLLCSMQLVMLPILTRYIQGIQKLDAEVFLFPHNEVIHCCSPLPWLHSLLLSSPLTAFIVALLSPCCIHCCSPLPWLHSWLLSSPLAAFIVARLSPGCINCCSPLPWLHSLLLFLICPYLTIENIETVLNCLGWQVIF